jgi:hypothetical protein
MYVCMHVYDVCVYIYRVEIQCFRIFCYVIHVMLKALVLVFFQMFGMEIQSYRNVCRALTDYEPVADLMVLYTAFVKHCNGVQ